MTAPSQAQLLDAIESLPAAVMLFDKNERFVFCNQRHLKLFPDAVDQIRRGMTMEELLNMTAAQRSVIASLDREQDYVAERLAQFRRGDTSLEQQWTDGRWFYLFERRTSGGGAVSIRFDITARKKIEEELRQSQRLEALGRLTGGVAHDFNNLLMVISGNMELMQEALQDRPDMQRKLQAARRAAERGATLTRGLLAFARRQPLEPQVLGLNELIRDMAELLRRTVPANITIEFEFAAGSPNCQADPGQLQNALLNLVVNAQDAMPEGGRLWIKTGVESFVGAPPGSDAVEPGDYVVLDVTDSGTGMDAMAMAHAFDPFFTTKPAGKGTGLGLSMVYGFVKQSGGHVTLDSTPRGGTTVKLYLPRTEAAPVPHSADPTPAGAPGGGGTILVVEDDPEVRRLALELLHSLGYRVREAGDPQAALQIVESPGPIDLLLTDIMLPGGMNGTQLASEAVRRRPGLAVLYMSGYAEAGALGDAPAMPSELLRKPFRMVDLAARVRAILDRG